MPLSQKQHAHDLQASDFWSALAALPYLSFGNQDLTDSEVQESIYKGWQDYIRISPAALYDALTKDLPEGTRCAVQFSGQQAKLIVLSAQGEVLEIDSVAFSYSRELTLKDNKLISTNGDIQVSQKNKGTGKILQRNMIGTLRDIGCASLSAASNDVGGYVWAKMGDVFNEAATSAKDKQLFVGVLRERLSYVQAYLPADMVQKARQNIEMNQAKDINTLADLDFSLNPTLRAVFENQSIKPSDALDDLFFRSALSFMHEMTNDYTTQDSQELWQNFNQCGQDYTLGKYLLLKTHWNSHLDFSDKTQVKRVEAYLGL